MPELQEAVAFDIADDHWDADKIPDGGKLIGLCRGLIIRDQYNRVRFAHHTVRQHLLRPAVQDRSSFSPFEVDPDGLSSPHLMEYYFTTIGAEFHLAVKCAAYLCFSDFESAIVKANQERIVTMRQIFKNGGPIAIPATIGLKRQLFQIPYRFLGGNGNIPMPEIDLSRYDRKTNQRVPPEMRNKYALLDYVAEYWPWHTKQRLSKTGIELHLPRDICGEQTIRQFASGKEIRLDGQIGCLPVFRRFWNLILHKNLRFEIRPWGVNQHHGIYGCQGCPPREPQDGLLERCRWSSLIHWAAEMGHVPLIQAVSAEIMDHLYHERYHHQTLKVACAHEQSELISYMLTAITRCVELLPGGTINAKPWSEALALRIQQTPYLIADLTEFCCKSGALEGLVALMDFGEHIHDKQVAKEALLKGAFAAASCGRLQVVKMLLDSDNIDIPAEDAKTMNLLHVAARDGHASIVEELLRRGSQLLNLQNAQGETPLILASQGGHTKVIDLLLKAGANVLMEGGELVPLPLEVKVPLLLSGLVTCNDVRRPTAIHLAAINGDHNLLSNLLLSNQLISKRSDTTSHFPPLLSTLTTMDYRTPMIALDPLECAAVYGKYQCVELLLTTGWRLNKPLDGSSLGSIGSIALHLAVTMGHQNIVRLLLQNNADPDSKNERGMTLLHFAADAGRTAIIALLLEIPSQPGLDNTINRRLTLNSQQTPLQLAIEQGHSEAVETLIKHGADPHMEYRAMGKPINALQLAIQSPKAEPATLKAVCLRAIPRSVDDGFYNELSDQDLLALAIEHRSPEKLQMLFDLGLRDGDDMKPKIEYRFADPPFLVHSAIHNDRYQCLEILLANCSYGRENLIVAAQLASAFMSSREDDNERYATQRSLEILKKKLTEMQSARASV